MRKKWTYVAIVSMMLGVAPVFTGCVDTDEPAGLSELRGAKAELLRAKAAVEQARVALVQAKADLKAAEAESKRANAEWISQLARKQEIENDFEQAKNELELQKLQAQLDSIQTSLEYWKEEAAVRHEKKMAKLNEAAAKAQYAYEVALKQIEVAKALGMAYDEVSLEALQREVETTYAVLFGDPDVPGDYGLAEELREANKELYEAQLRQEAGFVADENGSNEQFIAKLEADIALDEAKLAAAEQELADLQELAKLDIEGTDWAAEIDKLQQEAAQLEVQLQEKKAEKKRLQAEPDYLAKYQAVNGVYSEYDENDPTQPATGATVEKKGTKQIKEEAEATLKDQANNKKASFSIADYASSIEVSELISQGVDADGDGVGGDLPEGTIKIAGAKNFLWGNDGVSTKVPATAEPIFQQYEDYLKMLNKAVLNENEIAQAQAELKGKQEAEEEAKKAYEDAYASWETVKDIIANETDYQVDVTAFKKVTDAYNTAYTALKTAVNNYNTGLQTAYDEAYDEAYNEAVLTLRVDVLANTGNAQTAYKQVVAIKGFETAGANAVVTAFKAAVNKSEEYLNSLILNNCTPYTKGTTAVTAAQIQAQVLEVINAYVRQETNALAWANKEKEIETLAKAEADTWVAGTNATKLADAITKAIDTVQKAYTNVEDGMDKYNERAATFSQVTDEDVFTAEYLMSALDQAGKPTSINNAWAAVGTGDNVIGTTAAKYVIYNSDITSEELSTATKTTFEASLKQDALNAVSQNAFGVDNRYAAVELKDCKGSSKGALYYAAIEATKTTEAKIASQEDLTLLQKELQAAYNDAKADLAAQYKEVFAEEVAALTEATEAHKTAQAALDEADKQFDELDVEIGELSAQVAGKNSVSSTLKGFVDTYLQENGAVDENGAYVTYDPDTFEAKMAEAVAVKRKAVADLESELADAEVELKKAQDGKYDEVDYLTWKLSIIQDRYNTAMDAYTKAQEDLAKYMEIMAGTTDSEQPAE